MQILSAPVLIPIHGDPIAQGAMAVDAGKILAAGTQSELQAKYPDAQHHHFEKSCLMPGLVNAHTHLDLTSFPLDEFAQYTDAPMPRCKVGYVDWISGVIQYRKSVLPQTYADAVSEGIQRSLRSGTTCVGEISNLEGEFTIFEKTGMRGVLFPELISFDSTKAQDFFEAAIALTEQYADAVRSDDALLRVGLSPHAPYTVSRPLLKIIQQYAREEGFKVQIHTAESFQEMEFFFDAGGEIADKLFPLVGWTQYKPPCVRKTPIGYLGSIDFLKCSPMLVHAVQVSDSDIDLIAASKSSVVLCPRSNEFLAVGDAPVAKFRAKGIALGLGTDSLASNTSLSMWDEMRFLKRKTAKTKAPFFGRDLLTLATLGSAQVLGFDNRVGTLEAGKAADVIAVRLKDDDLTEDRLYDHLIEHTHDADIQMVMVAGKVRSGNLPTP